MFQYAAGRALAARHGSELVLDPSWFEGEGGGEVGFIRRYELGCFELDLKSRRRRGRDLVPHHADRQGRIVDAERTACLEQLGPCPQRGRLGPLVQLDPDALDLVGGAVELGQRGGVVTNLVLEVERPRRIEATGQLVPVGQRDAVLDGGEVEALAYGRVEDDVDATHVE